MKIKIKSKREGIARGKVIWRLQFGHGQTELDKVRKGREEEREERRKPGTAVRRPKVHREQATKMVRLYREKQPSPLG